MGRCDLTCVSGERKGEGNRDRERGEILNLDLNLTQ